MGYITLVIGATFGGSRVGVVNFDKQSCPYLIRSTWRHSVGGKLEKDPGIILTCTDPRPILKAKEAEESVDLLTAPSLNSAATIPNNKIDQVTSDALNFIVNTVVIQYCVYFEI